MRRSLSALILLLVAFALVGAACGGDDDAASSADIVDTAVEAGSFTTLASLLETTGLVDTLKGDGPFTVFAPTDDAFAVLPAGTLDELGKPENADQLEAILLYHVAEGDVRSTDLSDGQEIDTVQGDTSTIAIDDSGTVTVNGATITSADVEASNGVIHVIDQVLLPPA